MRGSKSIVEATRAAALAAFLATCVACSAGRSHSTDASTPDGQTDAGKDGEALIELESGLRVLAFGPRTELDELPTTPTAAELCAKFDLVVAASYETATQEMERYVATAHFKDCPEDLCNIYGPVKLMPDEHYAQWIAPLVDYHPEQAPRSAGYYNHPFALTMYLLSDVEAPARWYTSIYSTVTLGPLAGSTHFEEPNAAFFPAAWEPPATADAYSGSGVWARQIDAWPELCLPDVDAITVDALRRFYLDDLAACGIVLVMPMPVNAGSVLWLDAATNQCPPVLGGITVLMSGTSEHPGFATPCPKPPDSDLDYACFLVEPTASRLE